MRDLPTSCSATRCPSGPRAGAKPEPRMFPAPTRRNFMAGTMLASCAVGTAAIGLAPQIGGEGVLRPEDFGARGDGVTNDTAAFNALAAAVNLRGGGLVELRRTTYIVGLQPPRQPGPYAYNPVPV